MTRSPDDQPLWFPQTKLQVPRIPDDSLFRTQLVTAVVDAMQTRRLTLLSAPAGSGKTTLAATAATKSDLSIAWLTLDQDDNEVATFLTALFASLKRLNPKLVSHAAPLLATMPNPAHELHRLFALLINDVVAAAPSPFLLVLDDLHLIDDPVILEGLDYLLAHLPLTFHIAITTRHDPPLSLARLRGRGQLAEFRMAELRFNAAEITALFHDKYHLALSDEQIETLQAHTEGWVTALHLFALATKSVASGEAMLDGLGQANRYVFDLMPEEVLRLQTPEMREFLLATAVLPELTPALVTAVTENPDAPRLLEEAYRRNLFLLALHSAEDTPSSTYRYHALFAEFLQHHLARAAPDRLRALHQRAAAAETVPVRIMHHTIAAEMWPEAVALIEAEGRRQLQQSYVQQQLVHSIERLPEVERADRPWLTLITTAAQFQRGQRLTLVPNFQQVLHMFAESGDVEGEILTLFYLHQMDDLQTQPGIRAQLEMRLAQHPQLVSPPRRVLFHIGLAWSSLYQHQWQTAAQHMATARKITQETADPAAYQLLSQSVGPQFLFTDEGIAPIKAYCEHVLTKFGEADGPIQGGTYGLLSCIALYEGQLAKARRLARRAKQIKQIWGGMAYFDFVTDQPLLFDLIARGEYGQLEEYINNLLPRLKQIEVHQHVKSGYYYVLGRVLLMQDRLAEARQLYPETQSRFQYYPGDEATERAALLAGYIALHEQRYDEAEKQLRQAAVYQQQTRHTLLSTDARLGLARLYQERRQPEKALAQLNEALTTWRERGMPGGILQEGRGVIPLLEFAIDNQVQAAFARDVLSIFGVKQEQEKESGTAVSLSPREKEILQLVGQGMSNREIAAQLHIALGTVKRHTINIYNKVGVNNRTQAVIRAREWRLLD